MILFVNGCVRENSRTLDLANAVLDKFNDTIEEVQLYPNGPEGLSPEKLELRNLLLAKKDYNHPMFDLAKQFANADTVVLAAPFWNLAFPTKVRAYLEETSVTGITFRYGENGIPQGLCKATKLIYVTTSGGPIFQNFGFDYVKALSNNLYGIPEVYLVKAECLDIWGSNVEKIMEDAKSKIPNL